MNSKQSCHIRWRWFLAGVGVITVSVFTLWGLHSVQMPRIAKRILAEARSLSASGDIDGARRGYSDYLQLRPGNMVACEEYARLVLASSSSMGEARTDSMALKLLDVVVQSGQTSIDTKLLLVKTALRLQNFSVAHQMLRTIDLEKLRDAEMWTALGICELQLRNAVAAEEAFHKALAVDQTHIAAWTGLLEINADVEKDFHKAWKTADAMLLVLPVEGQSARAWLHLRLNELPKARDSFLTAARAQPENKEHVTNLAQFVMRTNMDADGENRPIVQFAYDRLNDIHATHDDYMMSFNLADLAQRMSNTKAALQHYQRCLELHPNDASTLGRMTEVLSAEGKFAQAEQMLCAIPEANSMTLLRSTLRAQVLAEQQKWQAAADELQTSMHVDGDEHVRRQAQILQIRCLKHLNQHVEAAQVGVKLVAKADSGDDSRRLLVDALIAAKNYAEAIRQMQLLKNADEHSDLLDTMTTSATSIDDSKKLESAIIQAELFNRDVPTPALLRARVLFNQGRKSEGIALLVGRAVEHPEVTVYWSAMKTLQCQSVSIDGVEDLKSAESLLWRCRNLCGKSKIQEAARILGEWLDRPAEQVAHAETVAMVVEAIAMDDLTQGQRLFDLLRDDAAKHLRETQGASMEAFSRILLACDRSQDLSNLTSQLFVNENSLSTVRVLRNQVINHLIDPQAMAEHNRRSTAVGYPSYLVEVLLAEADAGTSGPSAGVERLLRLAPADRKLPVVTAALLQMAGYDNTQRNSLAELADQFLKQHPGEASAEFLLSCSLRNAGRYVESVQHARRAFVLKHDPVYLLHAAYTLFLMKNQAASLATLNLAFTAGLSNRVLSPLDRKLLAKLHPVDATTASR